MSLNSPLELHLYPECVGLIDSKQVGYNSKGLLKSYDFADDVYKITIKYLIKKTNKI